jgi:tRNA dimethylallyltransferase
MKEKIIVIVGPTATGKSDLAVHIAKKIKGEIISADSRQVYKGLDIGTGKITKREMRGVPHHMLDVANPEKKFSVVKYTELAEKAIGKIITNKKIPIIVGGTGFYIQALVDGIVLPDVPPNDQLRKDLSEKSSEELLSILKKLDPIRAKDIDRSNTRRIIRSIEIAKVLGKVPTIISNSPYNPLFIGLRLPPENLKLKIKDRLNKRLHIGMVKEVIELHKNGLSWKRMYELGLEYRYIAMHLQNIIKEKDIVDKLSSEIWHYARRQMTWFKKDTRIKWFDPKDIKKIEKGIEMFFK